MSPVVSVTSWERCYFPLCCAISGTVAAVEYSRLSLQRDGREDMVTNEACVAAIIEPVVYIYVTGNS